METKIGVGSVLIILLAVAVIFSGCVEEQSSQKTEQSVETPINSNYKVQDVAQNNFNINLNSATNRG